MKELWSVQGEPIEDEIVVDLRGSTDIPPQIIVNNFNHVGHLRLLLKENFYVTFKQS